MKKWDSSEAELRLSAAEVSALLGFSKDNDE
jgi:hypothetical protein